MLSTRFPTAQADVGALRPPPGVIANLKNPDNTIYKYNIACQTLCYFLVGASVLARLYTKVFIKPGLKIEDCKCLLHELCSIAWVLAVALSALALACIQYRGGVHQWNVTLRVISAFARVRTVIYAASLAIARQKVKMAILYRFSTLGNLFTIPPRSLPRPQSSALLRVIFAPHRKAVLLARLIICLMFFYYLPAFFIKVFRCNPIRKIWDVIVPGKCITTESSIFLADCVISIISDLTIFMVVFAGGIIAKPFPKALAAIITRTILNSTLDSEDVTYSVQIVMLLGIAEVNVGIICSCLPILPVFYRHISRPKRSSNSSHSTYHRLETLIPSTSDVERIKLSHAERAQAEAVVEAAVHRDIPGADHSVEGPSISAMSEPNPVEESGTSWNGDGILKTVDVEQTGISLPERAALPREHMEFASPMDSSHRA